MAHRNVFAEMKSFVNSHVGHTANISDMLCGEEYSSRSAAATYLRMLVKLKYIRLVGSIYIRKGMELEILKAIPEHYDTRSLEDEVKMYMGLIPEMRKR